MPHLGFFYHSVCYTGSLSALIVGVFAYRRYNDQAVGRFLPLMLAVTLQLIIAVILQYRELNLPLPVTPLHLVITYVYFLAESAVIFTLPYLIHFCTRMPNGKRLDGFFALLWLAVLLCLIAPYPLRYSPTMHEIRAMPSLYIYRGIVFAVLTYAASAIIMRYRWIERGYQRLLLILALIFTFFWLVQLFHCQLVPILPGFLRHFEEFVPASVLIWSCVFLSFAAQRLSPPPPASTAASDDVFARYHLTAREEEIVRLLLDGNQNKEIARRLHITEATVKTHILNVYKKLGLKNRIQLARLFLGADPPIGPP